jgi:hypothetical protein
MPTYDKEFIIRYVDGELDAAERRDFEVQLEQDPSLAGEVALYQELKATLSDRLPPDNTATALRARLSALNKEYFKPDTGARRIPMVRWASGIAAAAVLLVVATLFLWPSDNRSLYRRLGDTQMVGLTERGDQTDTLIQQAAGYFNRKEFAKALPLLDRAVSTDSANQLALFYRGVASLHIGSIAAARVDLEKVYAAGSLLRYEAAFYLALSFAEEKNNAAAKDWLQRIPADAPVSARAKELKTSLK